MIVLFTDFGSADIYVGQVRGVLAAIAPGVPVIDLTHEVAPFAVRAGAHLLASAATGFPAGSVFLAVVDPGVGSARRPVAVWADGRWYVGPDNGLLSVVASRAQAAFCRPILWRPDELSSSFHGRDLFAPLAARLARGDVPDGWLGDAGLLDVDLGPADLAEVIYLDHYGNALTGLRACGLPASTGLEVDGILVGQARVFAEVARDQVFCYANSLGLLELAVNQGSAAERLGLKVGSAVRPVFGIDSTG